MLNTPVAFLIFNRPDVTEQVFARIAAAQPRKLLIVADGPRTPDEADICAQCRSVVNRIDWECEVLTNFSDINLGCGKRVSSGLDWVFSQVEEAIILEDDCVPHPDFFGFCEALLERYRNDARVMMITGTNYLFDQLAIKETYTFSKYYSIWGWATWRRAWQLYDYTIADWPRLKSEKQMHGIYSHPGVREYLSHEFDLIPGLDTWDVQWALACIFNHGLSVVPRVNLITNIGVIGAHTTADAPPHDYPAFDLDTEHIVHPKLMYPDYRYENPYFSKTFHIVPPPSLAKRVYRYGRKVAKRIIRGKS